MNLLLLQMKYDADDASKRKNVQHQPLYKQFKTIAAPTKLKRKEHSNAVSLTIGHYSTSKFTNT